MIMLDKYETISFRAFLEGAELETEAVKKILESRLDGYKGWKAGFSLGENTAPDCFSALAFFSRFAYDTRFEWKNDGVPFKIWRDTFTDLGIWQKNCRVERGEIGLTETDWLENHLRRKIFRLGRLQFVPDIADETVAALVRNIKTEQALAGKIKTTSALVENVENLPVLIRNERILFVHIPQGERLTEEECTASFDYAAEFFGGRAVFFCNSWILSPAVTALLSKYSNLAKFASRFHILSVDSLSRSAERYLFGKIDRPERYVTETSLQRKAKEFILRYGALGSALGVFEYKKTR